MNDAVHIEVEVVKLHLIGIGLGGIHGNLQAIDHLQLCMWGHAQE